MQARRILLIASLLAAGLGLSGCESLGNFDPESWFNPKKPLPGERKAMFPSGVPGVPQGVPAELVKGYQPPPDIPPEVATQEAPKPRFVPPERKPAAKPAPKPRQAAAPSSTQTPPQAQNPPPQAAPWPPQRSTSQGGSPFPDPAPPPQR